MIADKPTLGSTREQLPPAWPGPSAIKGSSLTTTPQHLGAFLRECQPAFESCLAARFGVPQRQAAAWFAAFVETKSRTLQSLIGEATTGQKLRAAVLGALDEFAAEQKWSGRARMPEKPRKRPRGVAALTSLDEGGADFTVAWGRAVLGQALRQMEQLCSEAQQTEIWRIFDAQVLQPLLGQPSRAGYTEMVQSLGLQSPSQAYSLLMNAQRLFARCLRSVVSQYLKDTAAVELEVRDLRVALDQAGKQVIKVRLSDK